MVRFLLRRLFLSIVFLPNSLFKKNKSVWVFYSNFGYKDSTKFVFEEAIKLNIEAYYFLEEKDLADVPVKYHKFVVIKDTVKSYSIMSKARVLFLTHGLGWLPFNIFNIKIIQFWHGVPIKKILLESKFDSIKFDNKIFNYLYLLIYRWRLGLYDYVISTGSLCSDAFSSSFGISKCRILEFGSPRHEIMNRKEISCVNTSYKKKLLYVPTWRESSSEMSDILDLFLSPDFSLFLNMNKLTIDIKLHPFDMSDSKLLDKFNQHKAIDIILNKMDIADLSGEYSGYIFDYSSAAIDFAAIDSKLIFFTPDYNEYTAERELYFDMKTLAGESNSSTIDELQDLITRIFINKENVPNNIKKMGLVTVTKDQMKNVIQYAKTI